MASKCKLTEITSFEKLISYLADELHWPIDLDAVEDADDLTFTYEPAEAGLDASSAAKVKSIRQIRKLTDKQPFAVFFIEFEPKKLPVVVLRRILKALVIKKRSSGKPATANAWKMQDLLFTSITGEGSNRGVTFAYFRERAGEQPRLETVYWDAQETHFIPIEQRLKFLRWPSDETRLDNWRSQWDQAFKVEHGQNVRTAKGLAEGMATLAKATRKHAADLMEYERKDGPLHQIYDSFRRVLLHDLDEDGFANMVAQTIAYGLFTAAVTGGDEKLGLDKLEALIPRTSPFLKEFFTQLTHLSGSQEGQIDYDELGVSDVVDLLNNAALDQVLEDFGRQTRGGKEDPVVYFYEDFLKAYDPAQRIKRGEFYTPKPVVSFIVRSVHELLKRDFDCPLGLADTSTMEWKGKTWPKVMILDPACGTGTFLVETIDVIHKELMEQWQSEGLNEALCRENWNAYVPEHLLTRLHGFELMMAPYSIAHLKIALKLKETGYDFTSDRRLKVYLTNTLEDISEVQMELYSDWLADEGKEAHEIKRDVPITVIVGNPPYAGHSANKGEWIRKLLRGQVPGDTGQSYFEVDGKPLGERNPKWLNDDYVKFIRWAQWRLHRTGTGVLGFITNHSYLDNPTFRGMRQSLLRDFNHIHFLDLHGNTKKKESVPIAVQQAGRVGPKDENVFDIQQGVAIMLSLFHQNDLHADSYSTSDLWGLRGGKYRALDSTDVVSTEFQSISPSSPDYLFVCQDQSLKKEFDTYFPVNKAFVLNVMGVQTHRDPFAIAFTKDEILWRMDDLLKDELTDDDLSGKYNLSDNRDWSLKGARARIKETPQWQAHVVPIICRPFDFQYCCHDDITMDFPRRELEQHVRNRDNLSLIFMRQMQDDIPYSHFLITCFVPNSRVFMCSRGAGYVFPVFNYIEKASSTGRTQQPIIKSNYKPDFLSAFAKLLGESGIQDKLSLSSNVTRYIYAVFHSNVYRSRYKELLKGQFPKIPMTSCLELFNVLKNLGEGLVRLHLMDETYLMSEVRVEKYSLPEFEGDGDNRITALTKRESGDKFDGKVWINGKQYFAPVPAEVFNFHIGGYQVCHKWLNDRRATARKDLDGKPVPLSDEDIQHYKMIVSIITETIDIMTEIDKVIDKHGGWPIS